jgi:hypothetical protein
MRVLLWITTVALVATSEAFAAPHGGGNYDGRWSVEVITDQGTCDRVYRWMLGIQGGRVVDIGEVARPSGGISPNGGEHPIRPQQRLCHGDRPPLGRLGQRQLELADTCLQRPLAR